MSCSFHLILLDAASLDVSRNPDAMLGEAQAAWRGHMEALWLTVPAETSIAVVPSQTLDMIKKLPDDAGCSSLR